MLLVETFILVPLTVLFIATVYPRSYSRQWRLHHSLRFSNYNGIVLIIITRDLFRTHSNWLLTIFRPICAPQPRRSAGGALQVRACLSHIALRY